MTDPAMLTNVRENRARHDAYFTERWCTEALLRAYPDIGSQSIWEPAAGRGDIVKPLRDYGARVLASDIADYGFPLTARVDFFDIPYFIGGAIVTNPPFDRAEAWCRRALELTEAGGSIVAMLLRNEFDCAASRQSLFRGHKAFAAKVVLTKRPRWHWPGKTEDTASPRHNYAWYVWDWASLPTTPVILYEGAE